MPILDEFRPITKACHIIESPIDDCVRAATETLEVTYARETRSAGTPGKISTFSVSKCSPGATLEAGLSFLVPLAAPEPTRYVFFQTMRPPWTVFFSNWKGCWGHPGLVAGISRRLKARGIFAVHQQHTRKKQTGYYGSFKFYLFEASEDPSRHIECLNDAGPWFFGQEGDPLPFEETQRFERPKTRERFTGEMLIAYLRQFGLRPYEDDFYHVDAGHVAIGLESIEKDPYLKSLNSFYSLDKVKR